MSQPNPAPLGKPFVTGRRRDVMRVALVAVIVVEVSVLSGLFRTPAQTETTQTIGQASAPAATPDIGADSRPAAPAAESRPIPRFEDFPVQDIFTGTPAPLEFAPDSCAWTFRTRLRAGMEAGPNFAGQFAAVNWGCGTNCQVTVVVDLRTGKATPGPFVASSGTAFRLDSRLIILNPIVTGGDEPSRGPDSSMYEFERPAYWLWDGDSFVELDVPDPRVR